MREILFRAKTQPNQKHTETGELQKKSKWRYGYVDYGYFKDCGMMLFFEHTGNAVYSVIPETVGQFTGLTDKNGTKIFEGDLCLCDRNIAPNIDKQVFTIYFDTELGCWCGKCWSSDILGEDFSMCEVIGNIHDNPELLEVEVIK